MSDGIGLAESLLGLEGFRVLEVSEGDAELVVTVETTSEFTGCSACGSRAVAHERMPVQIRDLACYGRPARLVWRKRRWRCREARCDAKTWTEDSEHVDAQAVITRRAGMEACRQVGENARPVSQVAAEFGVPQTLRVAQNRRPDPRRPQEISNEPLTQDTSCSSQSAGSARRWLASGRGRSASPSLTITRRGSISRSIVAPIRPTRVRFRLMVSASHMRPCDMDPSVTRRSRRRVAVCVVVVLLAATSAVAVPTAAFAVAPRATGAACVPGRWKVDLQSVVASSVTGKLSASGSIDIYFSRTHKFLQTYASTITGTDPRVTIDTKYSGAVSANYRATARQITFSGIENATSQIQTVSVSGVSAPSTTKSPADGTMAAGTSVTLAYTCRNRTMTITSGRAVLHLNRT